MLTSFMPAGTYAAPTAEATDDIMNLESRSTYVGLAGYEYRSCSGDFFWLNLQSGTCQNFVNNNNVYTVSWLPTSAPGCKVYVYPCFNCQCAALLDFTANDGCTTEDGSRDYAVYSAMAGC